VTTDMKSYNATPSPAQTVPKPSCSSGVGSSASAAGNMSNESQSYYDDHDNQLLHVNSARLSNAAAASSAPGPGLNNGSAGDDMHMRWWW
ncbi:hypothetical protein KR026_001085, partial [Drosophila bipectinata]